jgi:hypothetical protein
VFVNAGTLTIANAEATGSMAVAGVGGTGLGGHNGTAGAANATSLFSYAGTLNGVSTAGPSTLLDPASAVPVLSMAAFILLAAGLALTALYSVKRGQTEA